MHPSTTHDALTTCAVSMLSVMILWGWSKLRRSRTMPA